LRHLLNPGTEVPG